MKFEDWLIEKDYITDKSDIQYELSAYELDELYVIWSNL